MCEGEERKKERKKEEVEKKKEQMELLHLIFSKMRRINGTLVLHHSAAVILELLLYLMYRMPF